MCLEGTRIEFLDDIVQWINSYESEARALLVSGGAGTGKSSVMHTIGGRFKALGRLGSMFCFSDAEKTTRTPASLFPHISRDLADLDESIRFELCKAVENMSDRTTVSITAQFDNLLLKPANAIRQSLHGPIVIIIDALDECGTGEGRRKLLEVLSSRLKELPPSFRIIISSRPDHDIRAKLRGEDILIKTMDSIPIRSTANDIAMYVKKELSHETDINDTMHQSLASHARGLFQWANVACNYILEHGLGETASSRYEELIHPLTTSDGGDITGNTLLDYLYEAVLSKVLTTRNGEAVNTFKFVMGRVLTAFEPLSCKSLNQLFQVSNGTPKNCKAENVVMYLGSLLSGVDDQDTPIRPLHTSFRDFLVNSRRSGKFFVPSDTTDVHSDMALASLSIMKQELRFNICQLPTSYLANKDIPGIEELVAENISPDLSYACQFWGAHVSSLSATNLPPMTRIKVTKDIHKVLSRRVLYMLEVLSLLGASESGLRQFRHVYSWMKVCTLYNHVPPLTS